MHGPWHMEELGAEWVCFSWAVVMVKPFSKPGNGGLDGEGFHRGLPGWLGAEPETRTWPPGLLRYTVCTDHFIGKKISVS